MRMWSSTPTLPMSCNSAYSASSSIAFCSRPSCLPIDLERLTSRSPWASVSRLRASMVAMTEERVELWGLRLSRSLW